MVIGLILPDFWIVHHNKTSIKSGREGRKEKILEINYKKIRKKQITKVKRPYLLRMKIRKSIKASRNLKCHGDWCGNWGRDNLNKTSSDWRECRRTKGIKWVITINIENYLFYLFSITCKILTMYLFIEDLIDLIAKSYNNYLLNTFEFNIVIFIIYLQIL